MKLSKVSRTDEIARLIGDLGSRRDAATRRAARERLTCLGNRVVPQLLACLQVRDSGVRWEAAKILLALKDPIAAPMLCEALHDPDMGVQWVAAEALIALGRPSVAPLLDVLIENPRSIPVRHGTHHVLLALSRSGALDTAARAMIPALEGDYGDLSIVPLAQGVRKALSCAASD